MGQGFFAHRVGGLRPPVSLDAVKGKTAHHVSRGHRPYLHNTCTVTVRCWLVSETDGGDLTNREDFFENKENRTNREDRFEKKQNRTNREDCFENKENKQILLPI